MGQKVLAIIRYGIFPTGSERAADMFMSARWASNHFLVLIQGRRASRLPLAILCSRLQRVAFSRKDFVQSQAAPLVQKARRAEGA